MNSISRSHNFRDNIVRGLAVLAITTLWTGQTIGKNKPAPSGQQENDKVELGLVVVAIENALDEAAKHPVEGFPILQGVSVEVKTTVAKELEGGVKLLVFNVGGKGGVKNATSMSFELKPPPEQAQKIKPSSVNIDEIKDALTRQIQAAKVGFLNSQASAKRLKTDKIGIQVDFAVSKELSGGVDTAKLLPVGLSATGKLSNETGNTIKLTFGQ